jgi:hypothetical protein
MKQFAVAFSTTGNSPKAGHRFSEILLVGQENGVLNGLNAKFKLNDHPASSEQVTFPEALASMKTLVGDATLIVHNAGSWKRFLRVELRHIKRHGAGHLLNNIVDVSAWAHQRYPRQRKDVVAIARRAGIEIPDSLTGLELQAELLRRIANLMSGPTRAIPVELEAIGSLPTKAMLETRQGATRNWIERAGRFWRCLTGHPY